MNFGFAMFPEQLKFTDDLHCPWRFTVMHAGPGWGAPRWWPCRSQSGR